MNELMLPLLNAEEIRVLGSLMEKSKVTPEYYPMTVNGLLTACNQKTSRNPVVQYDESTVISTLDALKKKGLVSTVVGGTSRVTKYRHNFAVLFPLVPAEIAVICLLLLRGPLTPGEINNMSGRLYEFESLEEVQGVLKHLEQSTPSYLKTLPKRPGQKEIRYMHLLAGDLDETEWDDALTNQQTSQQATQQTSQQATQQVSILEERVSELEVQLAKLRAEFDEIIKQLS